MHSIKGNGLLKMAVIVGIMICTFGPGVEGDMLCYRCTHAHCKKKLAKMDKIVCSEACIKKVLNGEVIVRACTAKSEFGSLGSVTSGDGTYICDDKDLCNGDGSGGGGSEESSSEGSGSGVTGSGVSGSGGSSSEKSGSSSEKTGSGSGRLDSNDGLLIGLLMSGISLWFAIGSSISGRLSFSRKH